MLVFYNPLWENVPQISIQTSAAAGPRTKTGHPVAAEGYQRGHLDSADHNAPVAACPLDTNMVQVTEQTSGTHTVLKRNRSHRQQLRTGCCRATDSYMVLSSPPRLNVTLALCGNQTTHINLFLIPSLFQICLFPS